MPTQWRRHLRQAVDLASIGIVGIAIRVIRHAVAVRVAGAPTAAIELPAAAGVIPARRVVHVAGTRSHPMARDPVMSLGAPVPISRRPHPAHAWRRDGLVIDRPGGPNPQYRGAR